MQSRKETQSIRLPVACCAQRTVLLLFLPAALACSGSTSLTAPAALTDGPSSYDNGMSCVWTISGNGPLTLQFSSFALESGYDFVRVFDGSSTVSTSTNLLRQLTGSTLPGERGCSRFHRYPGARRWRKPMGLLPVRGTRLIPSDAPPCSDGTPPWARLGVGMLREQKKLVRALTPVTSSGGQMAVEFTTDSSVVAAGFMAQVHDTGGGGGGGGGEAAGVAIPPAAGLPPSPQQQCGGSQSLTAPATLTDGPGSYANSLRCVWTISGSGPLTLRFGSFAPKS